MQPNKSWIQNTHKISIQTEQKKCVSKRTKREKKIINREKIEWLMIVSTIFCSAFCVPKPSNACVRKEVCEPMKNTF